MHAKISSRTITTAVLVKLFHQTYNLSGIKENMFNIIKAPINAIILEHTNLQQNRTG